MSVLLTDAVLAEASTYAVTRFAAGTRVKGNFVPGASSPVSVVMTVHPATPREVQVLPEGLRGRQSVTCHAATELRAADELAGTSGDRFVYQGRTFEVMKVSNRSQEGGFWRAIAVQVEA